jgi:ADP-dependent NAD(P)H-hydrate dehydratase / NAD(P)H-hydrate epimerase
MIPLLTADEMRALEAKAIEGWGIPSILLQEHAALGALELIPGGLPIHVLAGPGNNGGDALALARLARLRGDRVEVWTLDPQPAWQGDAALQARLWEGLGGTYRHTPHPEEAVATFAGWVVDGLFGLGTRLPLRGPVESWVLAVHDAVQRGAVFRLLALDLPTGLDPSSAEVVGPVIQAHHTACFGQLKVCHGLRPARSLCGQITVIPIPLLGPAVAAVHLLEPPHQPLPGAWDTHKRDLGHVAIRAGTLGMSGAAVLAALGALRMGAGLVTVLPDDCVRSEVAVQIPEAMVRPWDGHVPDGIDVLLVGPGGVSDIPEWNGPLVLDASALNAGEGRRWMERPETVITPHPGEFARLFGPGHPLSQQTSERLLRARQVANGPGILVLKGAQSVVAGGNEASLLVNTTGHRGLSTGGTGDFLAGMIAAQVGSWKKDQTRNGQSTLEGLRQRVAEAVWLHGAAADHLGPGPLLVRELGASLTDILRELPGAIRHG